MKKLYSFLTVFCLFGLFFAFTPSEAGAVDVWVSGQSSLSSYVVTDSIKWNGNHTRATLSVKYVQKGKLLYTNDWVLAYSQKDRAWFFNPQHPDFFLPVDENEEAQNVLNVAYSYR